MDDSAPDVGWLQPVVDAERPLILELDGERVAVAGVVATCRARVGPCKGAQQNSKVRTTTNKSWPKLEVLPAGSTGQSYSQFPREREVSSTKKRRALFVCFVNIFLICTSKAQTSRNGGQIRFSVFSQTINPLLQCLSRVEN